MSKLYSYTVRQSIEVRYTIRHAPGLTAGEVARKVGTDDHKTLDVVDTKILSTEEVLLQGTFKELKR